MVSSLSRECESSGVIPGKKGPRRKQRGVNSEPADHVAFPHRLFHAWPSPGALSPDRRVCSPGPAFPARGSLWSRFRACREGGGLTLLGGNETSLGRPAQEFTPPPAQITGLETQISPQPSTASRSPRNQAPSPGWPLQLACGCQGPGPASAAHILFLHLILAGWTLMSSNCLFTLKRRSNGHLLLLGSSGSLRGDTLVSLPVVPP